MDTERGQENQLNILAREVLANYSLQVTDIISIQTKGMKLVWQVKAREGIYCLKRLGKSLETVLFTVGAQQYIRQRGGLVPAIIPGEQGPYTIVEDAPFVLYEWVNGPSISFASAQLQQAVRGLAAFHRASMGYQPPAEARVSSKLGKLPEQYQSMLSRLQDWLAIAMQTTGGFSKLFREEAPFFIAKGQQVLDALNQSPYSQLVGQPGSNAVLCHQDYGAGNGLMAAQGVYILDLDNVTFDLPARDLRKIINKVGADGSGWNMTRAEQVWRYYNDEVSLDQDHEVVLWLDVAFPYLFHDVSKNHFLKNKPVPANKLQEACRIEKAKPALW